MVWIVNIIERSGSNLTDYQVCVKVTEPNFFRECTDKKFVEFYDEDMQTLLPHYTELFDPTNYVAIFWVKVPFIPANGTKTIYLNVNTERTEDLSNPNAVFDFFDDFEGDSLNTDIWEVVGSGGYSVTDSQLILWAKNNDKNEYARIKTQTFSDIAVKTKAKLVSYSDEDFRAFGIVLRGGTIYNDNWRIGYSGYASDREDEIAILLTTESAKTKLASLAKTISKDTFYEMEFCASGNKLKLKCNGDVITAEDSTYSDGYVSLFVSEGKAVFEYIIIRKYTDPEPSVSVIKVRATATLDFKRIVAKALAGKISHILNGDPRIRLYSGGTLIKEITARAKLRKEDTANKRYIVMFLFVDDSNDAYTTDTQELIFPHPDGDYVAFTQSESFEKVADEPLPLRWEIYIPWTEDDFGWG